jgi:hypothetical protein
VEKLYSSFQWLLIVLFFLWVVADGANDGAKRENNRIKKQHFV